MAGWAAPLAGQAAPATSTAPAQVPIARVAWFAGSFEELGAKARHEKRPVLVHLEAAGDRWCARTEREVLRAPELAAALEGVIPWRVDLASEAGARLAASFAPQSLPLWIYFDEQGRAVERIEGYLGLEPALEELARVRAGSDTLTDLQARVALAPRDVDLRARFVEKLGLLGDAAGRERELELLRRHDRQRKSLPLRREVLDGALAKIQEHFDRTREINPGPLVRFLEEERHTELLFLGYRTLAGMHAQRAHDLQLSHQLDAARSKRADMRAIVAKAAAHLPANPALRVQCTLDWIHGATQHTSELNEADHALLMRLADEALGLAPDDASMLAGWAVAAFLSGDQAAAAGAMRRAIELEPQDPRWVECARSMGF